MPLGKNRIRFYTLPPPAIPYPFILINSNNPSVGLTYVRLNKQYILSVIVDSGVEIFRDPNIKDYPSGWMDRIVNIYRSVKEEIPHAEVWAVIPDYPDDYHPGSLWINGKDNVQRTLENILYALGSYPEVDWIIPIQGHAGHPSTLVDALELYQKHDVPLNGYVAVANICTEKSDVIVRWAVEDVYAWLKQHRMHPRIHVFGARMSAIRKVHRMIHSFDTMSWTRPRRNGKLYASKAKERILCFLQFLHHYADIIRLPLEPYWLGGEKE